MKSVAIFQKCHGTFLNRIVDGLYASVEEGLKQYQKYYHNGIMFLWDDILDLPDSIVNMDKNITKEDIAQMYTREKKWNNTNTMKLCAQQRVNEGKIGLYNGVIIKNDLDDKDYYYAYYFIIEIRHIHE